jgi:hypothetical protein
LLILEYIPVTFEKYIFVFPQGGSPDVRWGKIWRGEEKKKNEKEKGRGKMRENMGTGLKYKGEKGA